MEELDALYPERPKAIDLSVSSKNKKVKGEKRMSEQQYKPALGKIQSIWSAFNICMTTIGLLYSAYTVWSWVDPDSTTYKNLKGMDSKDRAYAEAFIDLCVNKNPFESKASRCTVGSAATQTLVTGTAVIAKIEPIKLPMSDVQEQTPGNEQSPAQ